MAQPYKGYINTSAHIKCYDTGTGKSAAIEGTNGALKVQLASSAGTEIGTVAAPVPVSVAGASINLTAPSPDTVTNTPVTGVKTVTATAAEVFAGASVLSSRKQLSIRNDDAVIRIRVGSSGVTQQNGYPVEPGASVEFCFDAATAKSIYAISEGAAITVEVWEA